MNADKVSSPKISPDDITLVLCWRQVEASSLMRNNTAWADQQCSSSWVTLIRHFEELMKAAAPRGVLNISFSILVHSGHTLIA